MSGKLLTGDHVLDPVTPHVGIWHEHRGDPLGDYVRSLQAVRGQGPGGALPAHGEPFPDLDRRVDELLAHETARERQVLARARARRGQRGRLSPARCPGAGAATRSRALHPAHQQFAVAETLAHLEHLRVRGLVSRDAERGADPLRARRVEAAPAASGCSARSAAPNCG